jgi:3-hydroxybutyryl-CoA dehydrogenase
VVESGRIDAAAYDPALGRITFGTDVELVGGAGVVIEAVSEHLGLKLEVLTKVAASPDVDALIASNPSSIPIAQLAAAVPDRERVLGLHFSRPCPRRSWWR